MSKTLGGRYQIVSNLADGGFGTTFVAEDTYLPGPPQCVVKQLKPQSTDPLTLQTARRLFDTEAQVLYELGTHDQIPRLLAYFEENQEFYLVQEFIKGNDLSHELTLGKQWSSSEVISLLQEILQILEFVHQQKVIHRDVNPRNLLRREQDGKLVLIDFGAVKQITTQVVYPPGKTKLTIAIGTPGYIPSEQAQGYPKFSSDVYAVGIIGLQALTGLLPDQLPKDADTNEIVWQGQVQVEPELAKILDKMVCYDFRQRYASATEALQALNDLTTVPVATVPLAAPSPNPPVTPRKITIPKVRLYQVFILSSLVGIGVLVTIFLVKTINSQNATQLYEQGNTLYDLRRYQEAVAAYEKAVDLRPDYSEAWYGQGKTLSELKQYKEALEADEKAIQIQPKYLEAWMNRGLVLTKLQRYEEAIGSFDKALEIQPKSVAGWYQRGKALIHLQRYEEALTDFDKAVQSKPDDYQTWYTRGLLLHNLKRYTDAVAAYDKAVQYKSDDGQIWYNRGNSLMNLQRYQNAVDSYKKAVEFKPDYEQAWYSLGNALVNLQHYAEAIDAFDKVVEFQSDNDEAWYTRGWALHQLQRDEEAIDSYDKAITLKRNNPFFWYNRGNALYNLKRYEDALASYNRAIRFQPNHYQSWYSRGNTLLNLKRHQEAIASYEKAIRFKPDYQQAINARNQTQQLLQQTTSDFSKKSTGLPTR